MQNDELQHIRDEMEAGLEKYSDLYDFAPVAYLTLDREGTIQEANLTAGSLLGIERSRLIKRSLELSVSQTDRPAFKDFLAKVFESKARRVLEVILLREGNSQVAVRIEATVAASRRECRVAVLDITERKRAEMDRLILSKLESTGILAGGIAHDFNNLLTVMLLGLEQARAIAPSCKELAHPLEEATKAVLTARGLTQQLITFASGGAPLRNTTRLSGVIQESVRAALSGSRVRCEFSLSEDLWLVEIDAGQIGQVIRNLVLNAREAMSAGGEIRVRAENVVVKSQGNPPLPPGDYVRVSIADRGSGIKKEVISKIYDPYFSTKQRGSEKGMGLGLTICHTIIQKHGGAMAVKSEEGIGTTFHFDLPASRKSLGAEKALAPKMLPCHGRILVMDDEEGVIKVVGASLRRMGYEVKLVEDGQKAVEAYGTAMHEGQPFDVVLLDLTIRGGMGGQEAIQALLKINPAVKAIVMSGYANDPVVLEPERYGFRSVLAKPFNSDNLGRTVARVLGSGGGESVTSNQ
jgi:PAS domain S-box-containing protein